MANEIANKVIGVAVGLIVAASLVPMALVMLANATLTGVDPAVSTILTVLLPILAVVGIAMWFFRD
jgi:hypothetical protein